MKKLFLFMILLLGPLVVVDATSISNIDMDIMVDNFGNATVIETWNAYVTEGTEGWHPYYNLGSSEISNLEVSMDGINYTTIDDWDIDKSLEDKAYQSGIYYPSSDEVDICFGVSSYGEHTYVIKYQISNFVSTVEDADIIYWNLFPSNFSAEPGNVDITIYSDFRYDDTLDVWGYGKYGAPCYVYDGKIEMTSDGSRVNSDEYMTILAKFPLGTFNTSNVLNKDFNYYYEMAEDGSTDYSSTNASIINRICTISAIVFGLIAVVAVFIGITLPQENLLKFGETGNKVPKDDPLYRDIPCKGDIFRAYFIAYNYKLLKKKTDFLGAIFLKWLKENRISIEKQEVGKIFKKEDTCIVLKNDRSFLNEHEEALYKMIKEASKDDILQEKEFEKWCSKNYSQILHWFDKILDYGRNLLIKDGKIEKIEIVKYKIFKIKQYIVDSSLMDEAKELAGLKKFLEEFTLIKEREPIEVNLFEDYLIFAQILGIAKKLATQFKKLYPEIIENYNYDIYDIFLIYTISNSGISSANAASLNAGSYSSGGGGFSSGGGRRWLFRWSVDGMGSR